jgi:hypothetical protein
MRAKDKPGHPSHGTVTTHNAFGRKYSTFVYVLGEMFVFILYPVQTKTAI